MSQAETHTARYVSVTLASAGHAQTCVMPVSVGAERPRVGTAVVVDTPQGQAFGTIDAHVPLLVDRHAGTAADERRVVRIATADDVVERTRQQQREAEARRLAQKRIAERGLSMRLTKVEHAFDGSRMVFYFTAESRVDFRELVRDLASAFRLRIEMRHIGVRDEAQTLGGYGSCGRPLCCSSFLTSFAPVSIKMAKQQNMSLNPAKLSGMCGRLKCCLRFEAGTAAGGETRPKRDTGEKTCGRSGKGCCGGGANGTCGCR